MHTSWIPHSTCNFSKVQHNLVGSQSQANIVWQPLCVQVGFPHDTNKCNSKTCSECMMHVKRDLWRWKSTPTLPWLSLCVHAEPFQHSPVWKAYQISQSAPWSCLLVVKPAQFFTDIFVNGDSTNRELHCPTWQLHRSKNWNHHHYHHHRGKCDQGTVASLQ